MQPDWLIGTVLDNRYHIERKLGEGGMGLVYLGQHVRTGRKCAVKLLPPEAKDDVDAVQRFEREGRILGALGHPGIVGIHDFSETPDGRPFFVMDYLEGEDLARRLKLYMSPEQARSVGVDARSDIYSLAALTFELLAGRPPFLGPNYTAVLASLLTEPPPKLSDLATAPVPAHLDLVLDVALSKDPAERHPDVAAFATAVLQRRPAWADTTGRTLDPVLGLTGPVGVATGPPNSPAPAPGELRWCIGSAAPMALRDRRAAPPRPAANPWPTPGRTRHRLPTPAHPRLRPPTPPWPRPGRMRASPRPRTRRATPTPTRRSTASPSPWRSSRRTPRPSAGT